MVRWGQSGNVGFVPNALMPRVFAATAVDLGAFRGGCRRDTYPDLCIHPGYKQEVGRRLVLGARHVALGDKTVYFLGPVFQDAVQTGPTVQVAFRNLAGTGSRGLVHGLELRDRHG